MPRVLYLLILSAFGCSEEANAVVDAGAPDAFVPIVDAGPLTFRSHEDFPRDDCDDSDSLDTVNLLGKWNNLTANGDEFSSYLLLEDGIHRGILGAINADELHVDSNNLFLHRTYNLTSLAINLCAVVDGDTLSGYVASCNGLDCTVTTVESTLVEPVTE